jgi:carnitine O-acetyltransferase
MYTKSNTWILSTSQLSSEFFEGWGYGEVTEKGFGLSYSVNANNLRWGITEMTGEGGKFKDVSHFLLFRTV